MKSFRRATFTAALLALSLAAGAVTQHVSPEGDDNNPGTKALPVKTIERALERNATEILMEHGNYFLPSTSTIIPAGVVVRGGYHRHIPPGQTEYVWDRDHRRTALLKTALPGTAAFILSATDSPAREGGVLEHVTILGGFASLEMRAGARIREVELGGGTSSTVIIQQGVSQWPSIIERSRITGGGGAGVLVAGTGRLIARELLVRGAGGRGMDISGTGSVLLENSVIQGSGSDGVAIFGNQNVTLLNSRILRSGGSGVVVRQANPTLKGLHIERNDFGVRFLDSTTAVLSHSTIVANRASGVLLERSRPEIAYNIIADNTRYGILEDKDEDEPIVGGPLLKNLFWNNVSGQYYDEGEFTWNTAAEINTNLVNHVPPEGNIVANPLFENPGKFNYGLASASPAIDVAPTPALLTTDIDGNPRSVALSGGQALADLGAQERQSRQRTRFGTEYYLESFDPFLQSQVRTTPQWGFNNFSVFNKIDALFLPGRVRIWSTENTAFGAVFRDPNNYTVPAEGIAILRGRIAMEQTTGAYSPRFRVTGHDKFDIVQQMVVNTDKNMGPTTAGRLYEMIFDLRQGEYRSIPLDQRPVYTTEFAMDLLDFIELSVKPYFDLTELDLEIVDRDLFDLQFNQPVASYTFTNGTDDWISGSLAPLFKSPIMRLSALRGALEIVRPVDSDTSASYFGAWVSPGHDIPAGSMVRIQMRVSTNRPLEQRPGMRFRIASEEFSFSKELVATSAFNGPGLPSESGSVYTMYARIPASIADEKIFLFWDLWNFGEPTKQGSLFLEEVIITRTQ